MRHHLSFVSLLLAASVACSTTEPATAPTPGAKGPPPPAEPSPVASAAPVGSAAPNTPPDAASPATPDAVGKPGAPAAIGSVNDLTLAVLRELEAEKKNVFFSATSLRTALGMTALGAQDTTLEEMAQVLHVNPDPRVNVAEAQREAAEWKRAAGKAELHIANRLFVQRGLQLAPAFTGQTSSGYNANVGLEDFVAAPEPSRKNINRWVADQTKQRIKELLPTGSLTPLTRMVLTNAIYFKGLWAEAFAKKDTRDAPFHTPSGTVSVPTMHRNASMRYGQVDKVRLVELPYKDSELAMLIVLPAEGEGLAELTRDLTSAELDTWSASLRSRKVQLALPKLEFSWGRSVKPELMALGIRRAFDLKAEFGGMLASGSQDLMIDDVFHKAFVLVDEVGTEAAAATGVVMVLKSAANRPIEMKIDRPFLFFVRNTKTGDVLFAGRVQDPQKAG